MRRFSRLVLSVLTVVVSLTLPLSFTGVAQAEAGESPLQGVTNGADSIIVGTVVERTSYWNEEHTSIYTSVVLSVEERLKGSISQDRITVSLLGGEVEDMGYWVSDMPSFDQDEKAVVFLKKLSRAQLPKVADSALQFPEEQFEVYGGFRGKFKITGDKVGDLPLARFTERVSDILKGQASPEWELDFRLSVATFPYSYAGYCWPHPPAPAVKYRVNENCGDCAGEGAAVQAAAATWNAAGAQFSFSYTGTTAAAAYGYDGVNEIFWRNFGSGGTIALTHVWYYPSNNNIVECDMEFNDYYTWSTATVPPSGQFDVQTIALHEFGHFLCLNDLYDAADSAKVMYGYGFPGTTKRALHTDDIAGIRYIYGTSPTVPGAPSNLTANTISSSQINLTWQDNSNDETGFKIERRVASGSYSQIATVGAGVTSYSNSELTASTTYYYRVRAYSAAGDSLYSNQASATTLTPPPPTITITSPDGVETWAAGSTRTISWTYTGNPGPYVKIELFKDGVLSWTISSSRAIGTGGTGSYSWAVPSTQVSGIDYRIKITSTTDAAYTDTSNADFTITGPPPSAPALKSPASGSTTPTLTPRLEWNASSGAATYGVQVATTSSFINLLVNETGMTGLYYDIAPGTLNWNTTYYWRVNAADSFDSTSSWSSYRYFKTAAGPPPNAPSDLIAAAISSSRIGLTWQDNSSDETGFKIERRVASGSYSQIATVGAGVTSYSNAGLVASTTYYYRVRAYKGTLNSDYCQEASAITLPPPPSAPTLKLPASGSTVPGLAPRLEWNASSGAVCYGIQVATSSSFTNLIVNEAEITDLFYDVPGGILNWNTTYYWRVNAVNSYNSTSRWSSYRYFRTAAGPPPNAPSDLVATTISSSRIDLTWQDNSSDETGFKIERRAASGSYSQIATVGAGVTSYSNTFLSAGTACYYRVRAYKGTLNSAYCEEVSATTLPPPPSAPTLKAPAIGSMVPSLMPRLEWNTSSGAVSYGIQVATSSSFASLVINETGITDLFCDVPGGVLNWNTTYYWRVNAVNSYNSISRWSSYRYFRTAVGP